MKSGIPNTTQSGGFDYQEIFDAYPDAVFVLSPEGRILRANQTAIQRYGYGLSELQRMHVRDLATPEMRERVPVHLAKAQHTADRFEWKHRCRDGSELPVEIDARPIMQFGNGAILACVRDISGQEALQRASEGQKHLLERTLDTEPGTVYIFDLLEQRNLYINRHWLDAYGYTAEETQAMGGELLSRIFHPDDLPSITANHAAWRQAVDGEMRSIEYRVRDKTGGWHWLMSRETPFSRDAGGKVSQILGIAHDVTERKMGELLLNGQNRVLEMVAAGAELQASLSELVLMVEELSSGMLGSILLLDKDGIHLHHGAAPSLPREYVTAIDGKAIGPRAGSCGTAAYRGETVCTQDIATDPLWEEYRAAALPHGLRACWSSPIFDAQQQVLGTFAMYYLQTSLPQKQHLRLIEIVTHTAAIAISRHRAKQALAKSEARFRNVYEQASDGIFIISAANRYLDANSSGLELLGYSREELLRMGVADVLAPHEVARLSIEPPRMMAGTPHLAEWMHVRRDGSMFPGEVSARRLDDNSYLAIVRDITERRRAEEDLRLAKVELENRVHKRTEQLEVAKARAEKADRLKSAFLATMSHELRTPLNSIIGFTGILLQQLPGSLNNEQMKQMTIVKQASNHLLALINDVLDISKVEAGELKLQYRRFDLSRLLHRISASFEVEARRRGVRLLLERNDDQIGFTGDERRIEQVLNNLLSNALKFTREGTIRLSCTQTQSGVSISVSDTGIGIKEEDIDKLFQPFSRINAVERQAYEGTGLGLAITRHLVEAMGGRVAAESQWGKGSQFNITLPKAITDNE